MTMPKFEPVAFVQSDPDGHLHLAEITKTEACQNLDQWDREVGWNAVPLHTADQLTEAYEAGKREQAAQIEMLQDFAIWMTGAYPFADMDYFVKNRHLLTTTPDQALEQFAAKVREQCAQMLLNGSFLHDQAPDKLLAAEAAKAIRAITELPK